MQQALRSGLAQDRGHQRSADAAVAMLRADHDRLHVAVAPVQRPVYSVVRPGGASYGLAMNLREEQGGDQQQAREIHRLAFGGKHHDVASGARVAGLLDALRRDDPAAAGFVAEQDDAVVGHILFSRGLLDAPRRLVEVVTLSPVAVLPERQGRGIGSALIRHGLKELDGRGVPLVFLEGNPWFYSRFGFERADEHGFRKPSLRIPDGAFQVARLSAAEPWMTGTFVYAETFWKHDCVGLRDPDA